MFRSRRWRSRTSANLARHTAAFLRRWHWRIRRDTLNQALTLLQPLLWLAFFGGLWSQAELTWAEGGYLRFITAGIVMMSVFNAALMGGLDVLVDRERGALDRFLVSPAPPMALILFNALSLVLAYQAARREMG